jgi:hypothetical protein
LLRGYQRVVYVNGPLTAVLLALGLLAWLWRRGMGDFGPAALLFASSGVLLVVGATMTSMFDYRYLVPAVPLIGAGGALGGAALAGWLRDRRAIRRPATSVPSQAKSLGPVGPASETVFGRGATR